MARTLSCRDVGVDCDVIFTGDTDDNVMEQAREHAARVHGVSTIPPELEQKCQAAIKDSQEKT